MSRLLIPLTEVVVAGEGTLPGFPMLDPHQVRLLIALMRAW